MYFKFVSKDNWAWNHNHVQMQLVYFKLDQTNAIAEVDLEHGILGVHFEVDKLRLGL